MTGKSRVAIFKSIKSGKIKAKIQGRSYAIPASETAKITSRQDVTPAEDRVIKQAVSKAVSEYGKTFKLLGQE